MKDPVTGKELKQWTEGAGGNSSQRDPKYSTNTSFSVTTSSQTISQIKDRAVFVISNTSSAAADIISITLGNGAAVAGQGIVLRPGNSYGESREVNFEPWNGQIQVICATANGTIAFMER